MSFGRFFKKSLVIFIICIITFASVLYYIGTPEDKTAAGIGLAIAYINSLLGFATVSWGYRGSHKEFMTSLLGGMIIRFFVIFILLFILIKIAHVAVTWLLVSLCFSYFLYIALEIWEIHKNVKLNRN